MGHARGVGHVADGQIANGNRLVAAFDGSGNFSGLSINRNTINWGFRIGFVRSHICVNSVLQFAIRTKTRPYQITVLIHTRITNGHQLVADILLWIIRIRIGVLGLHKPIDCIALTIYQITVSTKGKIAHTGQIEHL